jgi:hypothetical protein
MSSAARFGEKRNAYKFLVGTLGGRPRYRWEDDFRMDLT